jgi:hypothetical protein
VVDEMASPDGGSNACKNPPVTEVGATDESDGAGSAWTTTFNAFRSDAVRSNVR